MIGGVRLRAVICGGRRGVCSESYRFDARSLARSRDVECAVLYVVGGLYGNMPALRALEAAVAREVSSCGKVCVVFNGDFNFFNCSKADWVAANAGVRDFGVKTGAVSVATAGNVEREMGASAHDAKATVGCGCAYPSYVDTAVSQRAQMIASRLHAVAADAHHDPEHEWIANWLQSLPAGATARVGASRVAAIHGDPHCVNGWTLATEALDYARLRGAAPLTPHSQVQAYFEQCGVDVIAAAHTCLPFVQRFDAHSLVANNGAAGMPNFDGDAGGVVTRVAVAGAPPSPLGPSLYVAGLPDGGTVEALPLRYDADRWLRDFDQLWPADTAAALSYGGRMRRGVQDWTPSRAYRLNGRKQPQDRPPLPVSPR